MSGIVSHAVNHYIDLDVAGHLVKYAGPVTIIRRLRDEMITTRMLELETNRANDLLLRLLESRYPKLCNLETKASLLAVLSQPLLSVEVDLKSQEIQLTKYLRETQGESPCLIGEDFIDDERTLMLLYLARLYMKDVDAVHCTP